MKSTMDHVKPISSDSPEVRALAELTGIDSERIAAALNDPERGPEYITREEAMKLKESSERIAKLRTQLDAAVEIAQAALFARIMRGET